MTSQLDVLTLSETVVRDSQSGKLSHDLLAHGQTLYGKNMSSAFCKNKAPHERGFEFNKIKASNNF